MPYRSLLILSRDPNTGQEGHNICFFLLALSICNNPSNLYDTISQSSIQTNTHKNIGRQYRHRQHSAGILLSTDLRVAQMMNTELREEDDEKTAKGLKYDRNMTALGKNFQCVRRSPGNILQVSDIHVEWRSKHYHSLIIIHCSIDGDWITLKDTNCKHCYRAGNYSRNDQLLLKGMSPFKNIENRF